MLLCLPLDGYSSLYKNHFYLVLFGQIHTNWANFRLTHGDRDDQKAGSYV